MPYAHNGSIRIHYEVEGEGAALVLQHGSSESSGGLVRSQLCRSPKNRLTAWRAQRAAGRIRQ